MFVHCSARQTRGRALGGRRAATCPHGAHALVRGSVGVAGVGPRRPCGHTVTVTSAPLGRRSGKVAAGGKNGRVWLCSDKTLFTGNGERGRGAGCVWPGLRAAGCGPPVVRCRVGQTVTEEKSRTCRLAGARAAEGAGAGEGVGGRGGAGLADACAARVRHVCGACAVPEQRQGASRGRLSKDPGRRCREAVPGRTQPCEGPVTPT